MLDTFFNSAAGYRAQYLSETRLGQAANRLVLDALLPKVLRSIEKASADPDRQEFAEQSLLHPWSKVWVHQGLWLRHARREHRVLQVPEWQAELSSENMHRRKLARWGSLAPEHESCLLLKGGYVQSGDHLMFGKSPTERDQSLHELGFT
jgi:hypothetical protein